MPRIKVTLRTSDFFKERSKRADATAALALLDGLGTDEPPRSGDELDLDDALSAGVRAVSGHGKPREV